MINYSAISNHTRWLRQRSIDHGFMGVGISKAEHMAEEERRLAAWLSKGYHGEMAYMANHFEMRIDPTKLMPGAKSVISLMYNYFPRPPAAEPFDFAEGEKAERAEGAEEVEPIDLAKGTTAEEAEGAEEQLKSLLTADSSRNNDAGYKIARYAYGEDYHKIIRRKLKLLLHEMKEQFGDFHGRVFVDSGPVMERDWAKRSGLGWIGKNTLLLNQKRGSYFFLAEIITDLEFEYDHPVKDHCGTCTRCIDACPTDAISPEGYVLDGSKCISYLTIELKSAIPDEFKGKMEDWIFGCDICQEVCPWNRFSKPHEEPAFEMNDELKSFENWNEITEEVFEKLFDKSAVKRTGYNGLKRNIFFNS